MTRATRLQIPPAAHLLVLALSLPFFYNTTMPRHSPFYRFLLYVTNNEEISRHETGFDIAFLAVNTLAIIAGSIYLGYIGEWQWIPFLVIEYTWAVDTMRHNRP